MKKSLKFGVAAAVIAFATIIGVFGTELPVNVVVAGDKSVSLYFGEVEGKVWISLHDQEGYVFHSKKLKDIKSYGIQYELKDLPDGTYVLALEQADRSKNVKIEISNGIVSVINNYVAKPSVQVSNQKVIVEFEKLAEVDWNISIADFDHNVVFKDTMKGALTKRTYDLSNLPMGEYVFELKANGNSFTEYITLKK